MAPVTTPGPYLDLGRMPGFIVVDAGNTPLQLLGCAAMLRGMPGTNSAPGEQLVRDLLFQGEHDRLEFKRGIPRASDIARVLGAFANSAGGVLLLGVDDDGSIRGVDPEKAARELEEAIRHVEPRPDVCGDPVVVEDKTVFVVQVAASTRGLVLADSVPYVRRGAVTGKATVTPGAGELVKIARRPTQDDAPGEPGLLVLARVVELQTTEVQRLRAELAESRKIRNKLPELLVGGFIGAFLGLLLSLL